MGVATPSASDGFQLTEVRSAPGVPLVVVIRPGSRAVTVRASTWSTGCATRLASGVPPPSACTRASSLNAARPPVSWEEPVNEEVTVANERSIASVSPWSGPLGPLSSARMALASAGVLNGLASVTTMAPSAALVGLVTVHPAWRMSSGPRSAKADGALATSWASAVAVTVTVPEPSGCMATSIPTSSRHPATTTANNVKRTKRRSQRMGDTARYGGSARCLGHRFRYGEVPFLRDPGPLLGEAGREDPGPEDQDDHGQDQTDEKRGPDAVGEGIVGGGHELAALGHRLGQRLARPDERHQRSGVGIIDHGLDGFGAGRLGKIGLELPREDRR